MRTLLFISLVSLISILTNAQSVEGIYANKWDAPSGESVAYNLILNEDGTFTFQSIRSFLEAIPDKKIEATGTWIYKNQLLILTTIKNATKLSLDLNTSKARYVNVSVRNPKFNLVKPSFKFYKSNVFYAKNMELFKTETSLTSSQ